MTVADLGGVRADALQNHALIVSASATFRAAPVRRRLLDYLVAETLAGRGPLLKGYAIGIDVFGKPPDFDASIDSTVRVQVRRLRELLDDYYADEGRSSPQRLAIPKGEYQVRLVDVAPLPHRFAGGVPAGDEPPPWRRWFPLRRRAVLAVHAAAVLLAAVVGWMLFGPRADPPVVFVAAYRPADPSRETALVVRGLQQDLIAQLGQYPDVEVIGLDTARTGIERARALGFFGADYVLKGVVLHEGRAFKISSVLVTARTNAVVWSESTRVEVRGPADVLSAQSLIAMKVGSALGQPYGIIKQVATARRRDTDGITFDDYACVLSAYDYMRDKSAAGHLRSRDCLEQVVRAHPRYSQGWALLSWIYGDEARLGYNRRPGEPPASRALTAAERAVDLNPRNAIAHENLAVAQFSLLQEAKAEESLERAVDIAPNDPDLLARSGWNLAMAGEHERARPLIEQAIERNPRHPSWYWGGLALCALHSGEGAEAVRYARLYRDDGLMAAYILAASERLYGDAAGADRILADAAKRYPGEAARDGAFVRRNQLPANFVDLIFGVPTTRS